MTEPESSRAGAAENGRPARQVQSETIDIELIRALQHDGRASLTGIADRLGVSRDAVSQRLRALREQEGLRVVAALDPGVSGHHVQVNVKVEIAGPVQPVARTVAEFPEAVFVSVTSGPLPLVVESRHRDFDDLHATLDRIRAIPSVRRVQVSTYAEVLRGFFVSPDRGTVSLDALDHRLIGILQRDGRASYRALADAVHLSPSSARARVRRLVDSGVIRIAAISAGGMSHSRLAIGVGIVVGEDASAIREYITRSPDIGFAVRTHGSYDYITTMHGASPERLFEVLEQLRALPGVNALDSWVHYDLIKEDYVPSFNRAFTA